MMAYRIDIADCSSYEAILPDMNFVGLQDEYSGGAGFLVESALVMAPTSGVFMHDSKGIFYFSTVTRTA